MTQKAMVEELQMLSAILYEISINANATPLLSQNYGFQKFRTMVKTLNILVDMANDDEYANVGDE